LYLRSFVCSAWETALHGYWSYCAPPVSRTSLHVQAPAHLVQ